MQDQEFLIAESGRIREACIRHGFFYIKNHGVSVELQEQLESVSKAFFALPEQEKMTISMDKGGSAWRGFFPLRDEFTSGKPDMKEGIYFGTELDSNHPKVQSKVPLHGANLFPTSPVEMRQVVLDYMDEVSKVGMAVLRGIAISLGLKADYFEPIILGEPLILFRIFHYPAQPETSSDWGVGEHTDYGLLTILKQDLNGGLQVKSCEKWIDAPPIPNTFVCNIGDMLDRMTGGLYRSTLHRVKNISGKDRLSFPLFFDPNFEANVKPIEGLQTNAQSANERWDKEDVHAFDGTYGEYVINKVSKVFPQLTDNLNR